MAQHMRMQLADTGLPADSLDFFVDAAINHSAVFCACQKRLSRLGAFTIQPDKPFKAFPQLLRYINSSGNFTFSIVYPDAVFAVLGRHILDVRIDQFRSPNTGIDQLKDEERRSEDNSLLGLPKVAHRKGHAIRKAKKAAPGKEAEAETAKTEEKET